MCPAVHVSQGAGSIALPTTALLQHVGTPPKRHTHELLGVEGAFAHSSSHAQSRFEIAPRLLEVVAYVAAAAADCWVWLTVHVQQCRAGQRLPLLPPWVAVLPLLLLPAGCWLLVLDH